MWVITNKHIEIYGNRITYLHFDEYVLATDEMEPYEDQAHIFWLLEGYILPRHCISKRYSPLFAKKLPSKLFKEFGDKFINHTKGNFTLIQLTDDSFKIYSDRFGIKKFFYWKDGAEFIISNDLKVITNRIKAQPSAESMAIYALTYHFTGGRTLFSNVMHNLPGQTIEYNNLQLKTTHYWKPEQLLNIPKGNICIKDISEIATNCIYTYLNLVERKYISLSLTGGADTRNILAVFLKLGILPHLYTYGNPDSNDCSKARAIATGLNIEHQIYDIQMDEVLFEEFAKKILRSSGGLASLHRAHRLMAVEREAKIASAMFLGTLGGEYVKGVSEDDYITPSVVYDNWIVEKLDHVNLIRYLSLKKIKAGNIDGKEVISFLNKEPYFKGDVINRKHNSLSYITAHLHDAQDINLYNTMMDYVFTPFIDIDYLELIFLSDYSHDVKEKINNKYFRRLHNPVYGSKFIKFTYPPLLRFRYSGEHRPDEVLTNKYYASIVKAIRQKVDSKYSPNFALGEWMFKFVSKNLSKCRDLKILNDTFDIDALQLELNHGNHIPKESYWLKFTNPIMMNLMLEEYKG